MLSLTLLLLVFMLSFGLKGLALERQSQTRTYYIAAEELDWDYAQGQINQITGQAFDEVANVFVKPADNRIGSVYRKALYKEYIDSSFSKLKEIPAEWQHLGVLGPVIRAEVGDTIEVVFKNKTALTTSLHPHGVFYEKDSEGALYNDGTSGDRKLDDVVAPGQTHTYIWKVPERAGPGPHDLSSILWMYHGHTDETRDTYSGLIGPMIISAKGMTKANGMPKDVDREFILLFTVFDENKSWYLKDNIQTHTQSQHLANTAAKGGKENEALEEDEDFIESNLMHSINGYVYGNLPMLTMKKGERVRWYVLALGTEVDLHTPHWHGQTGLMMGMRMDMLDLLPGDMKILDMVPDNPGTWLVHCHVNDHIDAGMAARFTVTS
ncbi:MAG: multicopper oxidase domain-containing protein [Thermosynechococcaceae cyanobacterium]